MSISSFCSSNGDNTTKAKNVKDSDKGLKEVAGSLKWYHESLSITSLLNHTSLPAIVRIVSDKHGSGFGLSNDVPVILLKQKQGLYVQCQSVRISKNKSKRPEIVGPKFAIPFTFRGWFEVVSEDGNIVESMDVLRSLLIKRIFSVITRENVVAYQEIDGRMSLQHCFLLPSGTKLNILDLMEYELRDNNKQARLIKLVRCSDESNEIVFIPLDSSKLFSPIAKLENIAGVHSITDVVSKFRFPITVHLAHGRPPIDDSVEFLPFLRLQRIYHESIILAVPLEKNHPLYRIPLYSKIEFARARNADELKKQPGFEKFIRICDRLSQFYDNTINVPIENPPPNFLANIKPGGKLEKYLRRMKGLEQSSRGSDMTSSEEEERIYRDIDRLYEQVRYGTYVSRSSFNSGSRNGHAHHMMLFNSPNYRQSAAAFYNATYGRLF